jgi:hypothetical protein
VPELERLWTQSSSAAVKRVLGMAERAKAHGMYLVFIGD